MARYTKQSVSSIAGINSELSKIQVAIRDSLSRLGDSPNQMQDLLDMNSNRIINLPLPLSDLEPVRRVDIEGIIESATQAALEALAVALNPEKEGPVSVGSLVGGVFEFSTIEYTPGASEIWVFSNGSKLELGADYTESSSTSVTFTPSFLSSVSPDTRVEVWTVAITPNNAFDLIRDRGLSKYILLEDFNPLAGSGGDDTSAFLSACAASASTGKSVLLLNRTYLIEPQLFTTTVSYTVAGLLGVPGSKVEPYGDLKFPATQYCLLHINVQDGGLVQGFTVDAKVSQTTDPNVDPVVWDSSNYDTWYGSRGLVIRDSSNYHLDRVASINSYGAPIYTINSTNPRHTNCVSERSRGNYGDGYYNSSAVNLTEMNNVAKDFTRIGFVTEAFAEAPYISSRIVRINCHSENGHDSSRLYGGIEYNAGFWDEHSGWVTNIGCSFKDAGDRGFVSSMVASTEQQEALNGATAIPFHYIDCSGDGANEFVTSSSQQSVFQHYWVMENCHGINIRWRFAQLSGHLRPKESYVMKNCSVRLSPQNTTPGAVIQAAVLCQGGEIEIDGLTVHYEGRNMTDYLSPTNATKTISHSGSRASAKVTVNNLRVYDETGTRIPGTVCFRSPEFGTILKVTDTWLQGIDNRCTETYYDRCILDPLSTERSGIFRITNSVVKSIAGDSAVFKTISIFDGQTRCEILDTLFDLRVWSNYLHLFNSNKVTSSGLIKLHRCKFMWDAATNGYVIQLNANGDLKGTTNDIYNFEISSCEFENTGAATSNPILNGQFEIVNNAKVYGTGNYKSSNLSVLTTGNIQSNWSVKNFGEA